MTSPQESAGKGIEMMWQAANRVDLAAAAAMFESVAVPAGMRRALKWRSPGVSWQNG